MVATVRVNGERHEVDLDGASLGDTVPVGEQCEGCGHVLDVEDEDGGTLPRLVARGHLAIEHSSCGTTYAVERGTWNDHGRWIPARGGR